MYLALDLRLTNEELSYTREEIKGQREQMVKQNQNIENQNIENVFFKLLDLYKNNLESWKLTEKKGKRALNKLL